MKNSFGAVLLLVLSLAVATGVVLAEVKKGNYRPAELGSVQQMTPQELSPDSNYEVAAYPVPAPELAAGEGRQEVLIYCSTCHSPRYVTMQPPLPAATWEAEMTKMNKTFGAAIPDDTSKKILGYLQTYYTPENRKQ
jgi:hypothetical protein